MDVAGVKSQDGVADIFSAEVALEDVELGVVRFAYGARAGRSVDFLLDVESS